MSDAERAHPFRGLPAPMPAGTVLFEKNGSRIRLASPEDLTDYVRLNRGFIEFESKGNPIWNGIERISDSELAAHFKTILSLEGSFYVFIIEHENIAVGFANVPVLYSLWAQGASLFMDDFYVAEDARGLGLGRTFLEVLHAFAAEQGFKRLEFISEPNNPEAHTFYEKMGYPYQPVQYYARHF